MKITTVRRISKEDLIKSGGALPPWVDPMISVINDIFDRVVTALRNNLAFTDNFLGNQVVVTLTHDVKQEVSVPPQNRVIGIIPLYFSDYFMDSFGWVRKSNGNIDVTIKFVNGSGPPVVSADCTLMILYQ